jgi:hypothetical protein
VVLATCRDAGGPEKPYLTPLGNVTSNPPEVFVGAGDIAECTGTNDDATAALLDGIAGTVYTLGDNAIRRCADRLPELLRSDLGPS